MQKLPRSLIYLCGLFLGVASPVFGADIYIAQNVTGADTGANCGNAHSASWFNANALGGNTYHLCGIFTGSANSTILKIPTSGSVGNILNVKFEDGAILQAPYCSQDGCISSPNRNYVTIDGGTNGIIRNTANGTSKTYKQYSAGIAASGSNVTIKNLTIDNIYVGENYTSDVTDPNGATTWGISFGSNGTGNITIDNNILRNARAGVNFFFSGGGGNNVTISRNTTREHCWGIYITANSDPNVQISNFNVYRNDISDWRRWAYPYHQDGIMVSGGGTVTNNAINIHSNYIHGLNGGSATASIYCTFNATTLPGIACNVYNNLLTYDTVLGGYAIASFANGKNNYVYNNTIVGNPSSVGGNKCIYPGNAGTVVHLKNNIIANCYMGVYAGGAGYSIGSSDYNLWYNIIRIGGKWNDGKAEYTTWAAWQAAGYDTHGIGITTNPKFVSLSDYNLNAESPAINKGTSVISPLTFKQDYAGVTRPQGGAWDMGAYEFTGLVPIGVKPLWPIINPIE